ncbi:four helix bundle protein [Dialister sp.]|uniref:four helix bundle protein n=1 Tax=Dialister sp. TaxID=1955814 RepID=UPI002E818F3F|nr:four helix bundle protein [Dialister sp.]MEE3453345.1 four helix bundle protein [Dialister sp.]
MSGSIRSYQDLDVWNRAMDLAEMIAYLTRRLPAEEKFALGDQMRRAAVSIPSNIAEGQFRGSIKDYVKHLYFARGSNSELLTQLLLTVRMGYFTKEQITPAVNLSNRVGQMLTSYIASLKSKDSL